jgi:hypothetical protein
MTTLRARVAAGAFEPMIPPSRGVDDGPGEAQLAPEPQPPGYAGCPRDRECTMRVSIQRLAVRRKRGLLRALSAGG